MNRRSFIWISSFSSLAIVIPFTNCINSGNDIEKVLSLPLSISYIIDKKNIELIGKLYLEKTNNIDKNSLKRLLLKLKNGGSINLDIPENVVKILAKKIEDDFNNNNIIELDGWILSETEARQCAFYNLLNS